MKELKIILQDERSVSRSESAKGHATPAEKDNNQGMPNQLKHPYAMLIAAFVSLAPAIYFYFANEALQKNLDFNLHVATICYLMISASLVMAFSLEGEELKGRRFGCIAVAGIYFVFLVLTYRDISHKIVKVKEPTKICRCSETSASSPESNRSDGSRP